MFKYKYAGLKSRLFPILLGIIITSCGGGSNPGNSVNGYSSLAAINAAKITIDDAGTVPVIGHTSTRSIIYVHNNSQQTISGITYSADINVNASLGNQVVQNAFLESNSLIQCASIAAGMSCPLIFNTPVLNQTTAQGSALVTARYTFANSEHSFSQLINYMRTDNQTAQGAAFASGAIIHSFGNKAGYAAVYLYGTGINKAYQINSISVDKPGVVITQGNITGQQIQPNYVQAVEVSTDADSGILNGYNVTLTAKSSASGISFSNFARLAVLPVDSGAILVSSIVPLINAALESTANGSLYVVNAGNESAVISGVTSESGITLTDVCSGSVAPGEACTVNFTVTQVSGSGNITISYTNGVPGFTTLSQNVTWYNGINDPLLTMTTSDSSLIFYAGGSGSTTVTITNVGGYNLTNVSVPAPVVLSGSGLASTDSLDCPAGIGLLPIGGSCTYTLNVTDAAVDANAAVKLGITGNYTNSSGLQTYSRVYQLPYSALTNFVYVGNPGFSAGAALYTDIAINPVTKQPYVAYSDSDNGGRATVMAYNGTSWATLGSPGFSSVSVQYTSLAFNPATNQPYVAYQENTAGGKATVMAYNGSSWTVVGSSGFSAGSTSFENLAFNPANNQPYVAYRDTINASRATVMTYNGSSWVTVGSAGFSSSFINSMSLAFNPATNQPYVAYQDGGNGNRATVMAYNGTSWAIVGSAGFSAGSVNNMTLAFNPATNQPYVAYADGGNGNRTTVMAYNGSSWALVGSRGFSVGQASYTSLAFNSLTNQPYVAYQDSLNGNKATAMAYNGSAWVAVGNPAGFSAGAASYVSLTFGESYPYVAYQDGANANKATVVGLQ